MKMGMCTRTIYQCIEKKMTNGDKIRKMSDDELAETIACPYYDGPEMCFKETTCLECCDEWLKREAEG